MLSKIVVRALILICFASVSFAYAQNKSLPQVKLNFEKNVFGFNENIPLQVSISNPDKREIKILRWFTPIDGIRGNLFSVTLNDSPVEYLGAVYKRAAPTESDYLILKPGETIVNTVNLADYYDLSKSGNYQITYRAESYNLFTETAVFQQKAERLESKSVSVWIYGTAKKTSLNTSNNDYTTTGCNAEQTAALPAATNGARNYAANSYNYLNIGTVDARYTTWFGAFDITRFATARTHFFNIRNLLVADSYRIACNDSGCSAGTFAFVFPTDTATHTIYVCDLFWATPTTGTDSKAGTLIHEISHFNDIAATQDYVYGQAAAMSLAAISPNLAVNNADNHEYFAEASSPTAASAIITGKIISSVGRGIQNAQITLTAPNGTTKTALSGSFGYYSFSEIEVGHNYIISVNSKQFQFTPQAILLTEDLAGLDFIALP